MTTMFTLSISLQQVVVRAFATLAVMARTWESFEPEELKSDSNMSPEKWASGQATICGAFAELLQQAWLAPLCTVVSLGSFQNWIWLLFF